MADETEEYDFLLPSNGRVDPKDNSNQDPEGDTILRDWDILSNRKQVKPATNKDRSWVRSRTRKK